MAYINVPGRADGFSVTPLIPMSLDDWLRSKTAWGAGSETMRQFAEANQVTIIHTQSGGGTWTWGG